MVSHVLGEFCTQWSWWVSLEVGRRQPEAALTSLPQWSPDTTASPASLRGKGELRGQGAWGCNNGGEAAGQRRGRKGWEQERGRGLLTLCLNSDFSSRVMVSALAMTGMMLTTLLRCFINSRSRGRRLGPREGVCQSHLALPTLPPPPLQGRPWDRGTGLGAWLRLRGCSSLTRTHLLQHSPRSARTCPPPPFLFKSCPSISPAPPVPQDGFLSSWGFSREQLPSPPACPCVMVTCVHLVLPVGQHFLLGLLPAPTRSCRAPAGGLPSTVRGPHFPEALGPNQP